jgi:uncharacterized protein (TIGR03067 family)
MSSTISVLRTLRRLALPMFLSGCLGGNWGTAMASEPTEAESASKDEDRVRKELARLEGVWRPTWVESGGVRAAAKEIEGFDDPFVVKEGKTKWTTTEGKEYDVAIKVDPTKTPKILDRKVINREGPLKDLVSRAIYELEGDTLRICFNAEQEDKRPTKFTSEATIVVVTFAREKPEPRN